MYINEKLENIQLLPEKINDKYNLINSLDESYKFCLDWMSIHSKSFFFASRFLPSDQRRSVAALYAFCRFTDDIVDEASEDSSIDEINANLDHLKQIVLNLSNGYTSTNPILHAFGDTIKKHRIPIEYIHELIEGVRMDLNKPEYYTEDELDLYMYRVASTVGLMMTTIFINNPTPRILARASDLGKAMQLTNILRDIKEDYNRGRIYLPAETRNLYGVNETDFERKEISKNLIALIRFETERAQSYYNRADLGIEELPPSAAYTIKVASRVYGEILNEIKRRNYQVLKQRAIVSKFRKVIIALKVRLTFLGKI